MSDLLVPYTFVERHHGAGYVLSDEADAIRAALFDGAGEDSGETAGRGRIQRFPLRAGEGVLRRYLRGGLVARVLGDRYARNRMLAEFEITARLYAAGAAVPQPLGVVWERRGGFYRGAIATRALDGVTLLDALRGETADGALLRRCGERIRELHDLGVWHADLQVKNILVGNRAVWIIDFDNARAGRPVSRLGRRRNMLRLRRSLEKHGRSLDNFTSILAGYGELGLPRWLSCLYRLRGMGRMPDRNKPLP